uniref:SWIM-type domain-containing protein n=1 Tax=Fagus sylvatica TaxID=28930 RepID=A0A2N9HKG1_FAGSY
MVRELGYALISRLWFRVPGISIEDGGLQQVNSDHDAMLMTELVPGYGEIEVFVEHIVEEPIINSDLEDVDDDYNGNVDDDHHVEEDEVVDVDEDDDDDDDLYDRYTDMMDDEIPDQNANNSDADNSDADNKVEANADVESSAGVYGRRPRVESRRPTFPIFRPVARAKDIRFELGMLFTSTKQFKEAMTEYAVEGGWGIRFVKNDKVRVRAVCQEGCKFVAYLAKLPRELTFQLKTLQLEHSCSRCFKNPRMTAKFLAKKLVGRVKDQPDIKLRSIQKKVHKKYVTHISQSKAYRAKAKAMDILEGSHIEQYNMLWDYCEELRRSNPGSTVLMKVQSFNEGEMEVEDGWMLVHLKGPYGGQLIAAVGRDPNEEYFPLAFAVVEAETYDSWTWFLKLLDADVGENRRMTYMSDQQKGLVQCFETAFPTQEHRSCCRHIYNNLKRRHPGILIKELFWRAAQATYIQEFEKVMSELKEVDVGAHKCKIIEAREKPIISLVEDIRLYLMRRFQYNREGILKIQSELCPKIRKKVFKLKQGSNKWEVAWAGELLFEVKDFFESFTVDLNEKSCTCQRWKLTGIPCSHAITCIHYNKEEVDNYVDDCYKVPAYKKCYEKMILPINGTTMWAKTGLPPVKPPHLRRPPGRPKKNRVREPDEPKAGTKLGRSGTTKKCKKCGRLGHNKREVQWHLLHLQWQQHLLEVQWQHMPAAPAASSVAATGAAASPSAAAGAAASSSNTKAKKKQKKGTFTTITAETLRASKNASRYMGAFKVVGSQESVHGPIAKQ